MSVDFNGLNLVIALIANIIGALRDTKELLPDEKAKTELEAKIAEAENAWAEAKINLAQAWGYPICRRTLPPEVMLKVGYDPDTASEKFRCPKCGDVYPPPDPPLNYRSPASGY